MQAAAGPSDHDPRRWSRLVLVSAALLAAMSPWFAATAVAEALTLRWDLSTGALTGLTTVVQIGFVVGTALAALLNLADVWPSGRFFAACALLAAVQRGEIDPDRLDSFQHRRRRLENDAGR